MAHRPVLPAKRKRTRRTSRRARRKRRNTSCSFDFWPRKTQDPSAPLRSARDERSGMTEDDRLISMVCHPERSGAESRDLGFMLSSRTAEFMEVLYYSRFNSSLGPLVLAASARGLVLLEFDTGVFPPTKFKAKWTASS